MKPISFTTSFNGHSNVLSNDVLISEAFDPPSELINSKNYGAKKYKAIWDTGATGTVITKKVVDECSLSPIGVKEVHTAAGASRANTFLVNVWLPNRLIVSNVEATLGKLAGDIEVLIGMNIIGRGDFAVTNKDGKTVFSFRFPSCECIDFVRNPFKPKPARIIPQKKKHRR